MGRAPLGPEMRRAARRSSSTRPTTRGAPSVAASEGETTYTVLGPERNSSGSKGCSGVASAAWQTLLVSKGETRPTAGRQGAHDAEGVEDPDGPLSPQVLDSFSLQAVSWEGIQVGADFRKRLLICAGLAGALTASFWSASPARAQGQAPAAPSTLPATPAAIGPFLQPEGSPSGGYYVTCDLSNLSPNCHELVAVRVTGSTTPSSVPQLVTFLVNVPSAYQYLTNWVPYTTRSSWPAPASSASTDSSYTPYTASGCGTTAGTAINGPIPTSWNVPSGTTITVAAAIYGTNGNVLRSGFLIGQFGSVYRNYPSPFYGESSASGSAVFDFYNTQLPSGVYVSSNVANTNNVQGIAYVENYATGQTYFDADFGTAYSVDNVTRCNQVVDHIDNSSTANLNSNGGYVYNAYYQPLGSTEYDLWSEGSEVSSGPYEIVFPDGSAGYPWYQDGPIVT